MKTRVEISKRAIKQINKAPKEIVESIAEWVLMLETIGLDQTRKQGGVGLHDEALKGRLKDLRSIRLNRSWRLYYMEYRDEIVVVEIMRVDKHEY